MRESNRRLKVEAFKSEQSRTRASCLGIKDTENVVGKECEVAGEIVVKLAMQCPRRERRGAQ